MGSRPEKRLRATVFARLLLILAAVAALPTAVVMVAQERALVRDLEDAAAGRLDRARRASEALLEQHVQALSARYRAVSGTPQFRATLELGDQPTLRFYADELARREGAASIAFVSATGVVAGGGADPSLTEAASAAREPVVAHAGSLHIRIDVPLLTGGEQVGRLVAVERVGEQRLAEWSETCGATVAFEPAPSPGADRLVASVRRIGDGHLTVSLSLVPERLALAHARRNLAFAGLVALGLALAASVALSRSWVRPIVQMQRAAERIGRGDFEARIGIERGDEIGDVARAFDDMTLRLREFRSKVGEQRAALEAKVRELGASRERLQNAQRMARMGSWWLDLRTGRVELSPELTEIFEMGSPGGAFGLKDLLELLHPEDRDAVVEAVRACLEERASLHLDHRVLLADGSERIVKTQARFERGDGGEERLEGTVQDVTERKRAEEQIRYLAHHDSLTGLGNRRLFQERLDFAVAEGRRSRLPFGVLFLDLDQFKRINDTLGHSVGDRLLQGVADRLVASVRETDVVARSDPAAAVTRFGSDVFTVLIARVEHPRELAKVARRMLSVLSKPFALEGHEIVVTASVGIAGWPADGEDAETLLRNADAALHHAKEQGRNAYQFYTAAMNAEALERLILESRLRGALERDEFEVHYQPKFHADGRRVSGVEALVRWRDPEVGLVSPGEFIPIAEETGMVGAIGDLVLQRACADRARWNQAGIPEFPVAVNLSPHQFRDGGLVARVQRFLSEAGLDPRWLELEITESTLLHDEALVVQALSALRAKDITVAVDDFGTGYSSLAYLGRLPVDSLKIDRSFVIGIGDHAGEAALACAIVAMGHALELRVVAEGVETTDQHALLRGWGCDELQGFLFARPMPEPALIRFLREKDRA